MGIVPLLRSSTQVDTFPRGLLLNLIPHCGSRWSFAICLPMGAETLIVLARPQRNGECSPESNHDFIGFI